MVRFREVLKKYGENPTHFIIPMLFALLLSITALFAVLGVYFILSMFYTALDLPQEAYLYTFGFLTAFFLLLLAGFKGGIIEGFYLALKGRRIKLVEFLRVARRTAFPILFASLLRLLLWGVAFLPLVYVVYNGLDVLYVWVSFLYSIVALTLFEYLLLPQYAVITVLEEPLLASFKKAVRLSIVHWRQFLPVFILLSINFLLKYVPVLNLISFFFLYPIAYSVLVGRVAAYGRHI